MLRFSTVGSLWLICQIYRPTLVQVLSTKVVKRLRINTASRTNTQLNPFRAKTTQEYYWDTLIKHTPGQVQTQTDQTLVLYGVHTHRHTHMHTHTRTYMYMRMWTHKHKHRDTHRHRDSHTHTYIPTFIMYIFIIGLHIS